MMDWRNRSGLALVFLILVGVFVIVVVIGGVSYVFFKDSKSIVPVPPVACHCSDTADIRNRLNEVGAAAAKYAQMASTITTADGPAGKPTMFSKDQWKQGEDAVQKDVNAAYTAGAKSGEGETDTACITRVESASACIRASLQTHENVHAATCQAVKQSGRIGTYDDYKATMTMADYWREEIAAYTEEARYLSSNLAQAMGESGCNPPPAAVKAETYPGRESKEDMRVRLAGAWRRLSAYVGGTK
jgi:hypothetical protein